MNPSNMHREQRARIMRELRRLRAAGWVIVAAPRPVEVALDGWHVDAWHRDRPDAPVISQRRVNLWDAYAHVIMACDYADSIAAKPEEPAL